MPKQSLEDRRAALLAELAQVEELQKAEDEARHRLLGEVVEKACENDMQLKSTINALLNKALKKKSDRLLFGLNTQAPTFTQRADADRSSD